MLIILLIYNSLSKRYLASSVLFFVCRYTTIGARDIMHMRLTKNEAFIRFVGANHPSDYIRLDDWVLRLKEWVDSGLINIHFFIHQNVEEASPLLASYFIKKLNKELGTSLKIPGEGRQINLF